MRRLTRLARLAAAVLGICAGTLAAPVTAQDFSRPTACSDCIANWFYFDNNAGAAGSEDWSCASSSYDGHRGSDFSLRGGNAAIDAGHDVVAAAAGVVVRAQDGHYDRCTACGDAMCGTDFGFGYGNHVVVNHGSYRVVYAHMRNGSVRVSVGDSVSCGQAVGQIGSSGCTTGAHLHFETRPLDGASTTAFDPFAGGCSPTSPSLFASQGAHRGLPAATCGGPPPPTCPAGTFDLWTCDADDAGRTRCIDGVVEGDACAEGCSSMPVGTDDVCRMATSDCGGVPTSWTCGTDLRGRSRCAGGALESMLCPGGCMPMPSGDDVCLGGAVDAGPADSGPTDSGLMDGAADGALPDGAADGGVPEAGPSDTATLKGGCAVVTTRGGPGVPWPALGLLILWRRARPQLR